MKNEETLGKPVVPNRDRIRKIRSLINADIGEELINTMPYADMDREERRICIRYLVGESNTEEELKTRLSELGVTYCALTWSKVIPEDETGLKLLKSLGSLISKKGAIVAITTSDDLF